MKVIFFKMLANLAPSLPLPTILNKLVTERFLGEATRREGALSCCMRKLLDVESEKNTNSGPFGRSNYSILHEWKRL